MIVTSEVEYVERRNSHCCLRFFAAVFFDKDAKGVCLSPHVGSTPLGLLTAGRALS